MAHMENFKQGENTMCIINLISGTIVCFSSVGHTIHVHIVLVIHALNMIQKLFNSLCHFASNYILHDWHAYLKTLTWTYFLHTYQHILIHHMNVLSRLLLVLFHLACLCNHVLFIIMSLLLGSIIKNFWNMCMHSAFRNSCSQTVAYWAETEHRCIMKG